MKTFIAILVVLLLGVGAYMVFRNSDDGIKTGDSAQEETKEGLGDLQRKSGEETEENGDDQSATPAEGEMYSIGESVEGRTIEAYSFGSSDGKHLVFVGGIHGGYSPNTSLVAYQLVDQLKKSNNSLPEGLRVTVIPTLNPDGLYKATEKEGRFAIKDVSVSQDLKVASRFNANGVDLNRNFDCDWKTEGVWQNTKVDGGDKAFSEPEAKAFQKFVNENGVDAVVAWYSAAGGVFSSSCGGEKVTPEVKEMTNVFAKASKYPAQEEFDFYEVNGDMVNWLAKENIPGISVLLTNHTDPEWSRNWAGIKALFDYLTK